MEGTIIGFSKGGLGLRCTTTTTTTTIGLPRRLSLSLYRRQSNFIRGRGTHQLRWRHDDQLKLKLISSAIASASSAESVREKPKVKAWQVNLAMDVALIVGFAGYVGCLIGTVWNLGECPDEARKNLAAALRGNTQTVIRYELETRLAAFNKYPALPDWFMLHLVLFFCTSFLLFGWVAQAVAEKNKNELLLPAFPFVATSYSCISGAHSMDTILMMTHSSSNYTHLNAALFLILSFLYLLGVYTVVTLLAHKERQLAGDQE